jgi:hypothetical protein
MSGPLGGPLPQEITPQCPFPPPLPPPHVSDEEVKLYYAGLPSRPILIARTDRPGGVPPGYL